MIKSNVTAALIRGLCIVTILLLTHPAHAGLFGASERKRSDLRDFPKWTEMLSRFQTEESDCNTGKGTDCSTAYWDDFIKANQGQHDKLELLQSVNSFANEIKYVPDIKGWNQSDYWETPLQFFVKGGDCEDYAITKFITLRRLGFDNKDMRVVVLFDRHKRLLHSVLVVRIDRVDYLLDNDIPVVVKTKEIRHYEPIYSINETNWWDHRMTL